MADDKETIFKTSDTPLTAYLRGCEGFTLVDIEYSEGRAFYIFQDDSGQLQKCVHDFNMGAAVGNINDFYNAYRVLIRKVKNGLPWIQKHKHPVIEEETGAGNGGDDEK